MSFQVNNKKKKTRPSKLGSVDTITITLKGRYITTSAKMFMTWMTTVRKIQESGLLLISLLWCICAKSNMISNVRPNTQAVHTLTNIIWAGHDLLKS